MRGFMVLCLAAVATALPQGYNYPSPGLLGGSSNVHQTTVGFGQGGLVGGGLVGGGQAGGLLVGGGQGGGLVGSGLVNGGGFVNGGLVQGGLVGGGFVSGGHATHVGHHGAAHHQAIVSKHFHLFAAPEETEHDVRQEVISTGPAHKHYRVVFIKAPHQSSKAAALTFAQAANEEKTVIYVLSKKTDAADIQAAIKQAPQVHNKPEVYFIKYKTAEEAAHAQHTIQAQYDSLGGSTAVSDEGLAPVTSVIGSLGGSHGGASHGSSGSVLLGQTIGAGNLGSLGSAGSLAPVGTASPTVSTNYLPPHH